MSEDVAFPAGDMLHTEIFTAKEMQQFLEIALPSGVKNCTCNRSFRSFEQTNVKYQMN